MVGSVKPSHTGVVYTVALLWTEWAQQTAGGIKAQLAGGRVHGASLQLTASVRLEPSSSETRQLEYRA